MGENSHSCTKRLFSPSVTPMRLGKNGYFPPILHPWDWGKIAALFCCGYFPPVPWVLDWGKIGTPDRSAYFPPV